VGLTEYLANELGIEYVPVGNYYKNRWEREAKEGKIAGLIIKREKGKTGRPKAQ